MIQQDNLLSRLRAETTELHRAIEATPLSAIIVSPAITRQDYSRYLQKMLLLHSAVETAVFPSLQNIVSGLEQRRKSGAIRKDLAALSEEEFTSGHSFLEKEDHTDPAFNLGIMYVTEGSSLGGQFILKNIKAALGADAPSGFLNVYGSQTGSRWKEFLEDLGRYAATQDEAGKNRIVEGAKYGFRQTLELFSQS